ncbi:translation initiation factor Sui1 [Desulfogranum japonicum]|uniref:translation initiation factor Sui1 n=1 Tax=Desulfogranum japonicum TaxID=231447 RepID=UPI00041AB28F|nr:translation initiation factor Sui1 [Desulfogranum japonicum]
MTKRNKEDHRLVYSSGSGRVCPLCGISKAQCICRKQLQAPSQDGVVRISRQTKGRKGSGVCLVTGIPLAEKDLKALAKRLKQRCGTGGTVKNGVIEIQGDHRQVLLTALKDMGYEVKLAGG